MGKKNEIDSGARERVTSEEREPIKALEREVKELLRANEILKLASAFFARAELDSKLKSGSNLSTSIAMPTGSSRFAKCCQSPRRILAPGQLGFLPQKTHSARLQFKWTFTHPHIRFTLQSLWVFVVSALRVLGFGPFTLVLKNGSPTFS